MIPDPAPCTEPQGARATDRRALLDGIGWILGTGSPWADLPHDYPPKLTVHRWFKRWVVKGVCDRIVTRLAAESIQGRTF